MGLFEQGAFLLDNRVKVRLLECISDCLRCDRMGNDVVDIMGSLNSIIKLSCSDLLNDGLSVMRRKLGRLTPFAVFFVSINLLLDPSNSGLAHTSFVLNLTQGITFLKKGDDRRVLDRGYGFHGVIEGKENG